MLRTALSFIFAIGLVSGGEPEVNCPAPKSPDHGQSFLYQEGQVVKYVCEPGFELRGGQIVRCVEGAWEEPAPTCVAIGEDTEDTLPFTAPEDVSAPIPPPRPLFNWGDDVTEEDDMPQEDDSNSTSPDDVAMGDQARVRTVIYPGRLLVRNALLRRAALRNRVNELEEEDRKAKTGGATTTILQAPPSVLYLRRTEGTGKSLDMTPGQLYRTAALHMRVEQEGDQEQPQSDKGEDAVRQYYWMAQHYYNHPRQASSLVDYASVYPYSLSESQMAWINSLHPELRDQYLRDMYVTRADHAAEGARAQAFLSRYGDAYHYYHPYYYRQAMSLVSQDIVSHYDYSCNQAGSPFVTAPKLRNAHIARYDRRQNPNAPNNNYLAAVYRCNPGYVMLDTRNTELFCSRKSWIGADPVCVRARV